MKEKKENLVSIIFIIIGTLFYTIVFIKTTITLCTQLQTGYPYTEFISVTIIGILLMYSLNLFLIKKCIKRIKTML